MARACVCGRVGCTRHGRRPTHKGWAWGTDHQRRRREMLRTTPEVCARCGQGPIQGDPWEAGHIEAVALGGGPEVQREHRSCNRRHGAELRTELRRSGIEKKAAERIERTENYLDAQRDFSQRLRARPSSADGEKNPALG